MEHFYTHLPKAMAAIPLLIGMSCYRLNAQNLEGFWDEIATRIDREEYFRIAGSLQLELRMN